MILVKAPHQPRPVRFRQLKGQFLKPGKSVHIDDRTLFILKSTGWLSGSLFSSFIDVSFESGKQMRAEFKNGRKGLQGDK
jgi:hypothetical protein